MKTKCSHEKSRAYMLTVNHLQTHIQQSHEIEQVLGFAQYKRTSMPMHFRHTVNMEEIGKVTLGMSRYMKSLYVYHCTRKPGYVLEFSLRRDDYYRCEQCRKVGKVRTIVIRDNAVVAGNKHSEDDHHVDCQPVLETGENPRHFIAVI